MLLLLLVAVLLLDTKADCKRGVDEADEELELEEWEAELYAAGWKRGSELRCRVLFGRFECSAVCSRRRDLDGYELGGSMVVVV